jgi:chromosome segregation ATPase
MNWLTAAFAFVFFCNLVFMVGAFYALMRVLDTTEKSGIELQRAASHIVEAGGHVKVMVRRMFTEMERSNDQSSAREGSGSRAIAEMSFQIKTLQDQIKDSFANMGGAGKRHHEEDPDQPTPEDLRVKLHAELNSALAKNHLLQDEIDQTKYRLKDASIANTMLMQEIGEVKGVKQSVVDGLMERATELEQQLKKAQERAKAAERHAEENAMQLDDIRAQISEQKFAASVKHLNHPDQSNEIADMQDKIDVLASREKALLARIAVMEGEFQRSLTEKQFIEDRFLMLDTVPITQSGHDGAIATGTPLPPGGAASA